MNSDLQLHVVSRYIMLEESWWRARILHSAVYCQTRPNIIQPNYMNIEMLATDY